MSRSARVIAMVAVLTLAIASGAAAIESEEPTDDGSVDPGTDQLIDSWFWYDAGLMQLTYGLPDAETGETPDCGPIEETDAGTLAESVVGDEDTVPEVTEGCRVVDVARPSGKVTHGSVVSSFVHSLKEDYDKELYGPKGQWVREVAWSSHGKWWADDGEGSEEATEAGPDKTKKPKKAKKAKKPKYRDR